MNGHYKSAPTFENISFEYAKKLWEERILDFVKTISSETSLRNAKWDIRKMRVNVYPTDENGLKKRGGSLHRYFVEIELKKEETEKIWNLFEQFSKKYGLEIERWTNNEKDLDRYHFEAIDIKTDDSISCKIDLPNEWNNPCAFISVFVGGRYRQIDLDNLVSKNDV